MSWEFTQSAVFELECFTEEKGVEFVKEGVSCDGEYYCFVPLYGEVSNLVTVRIRKVSVLTGAAKMEAEKLGFCPDDLVLVTGDKIEKVIGDPVSFLLKRSCCEENGITLK